jgi:ParB/RepB/Spo0J family partition protein
MDELRDLPIAQLVEPWILLRPVDRTSVGFLEMKDSIDARGFLNSISARPCKRHPGLFEIIDGMYRWTCATELCLETIPTIVKQNITDDDVLALQLQANAIRPETKPCEFAKQLKRLQKAHPGITLGKLSVMLSKSPGWIGSQLNLLFLTIEQQKMVDRGEICLQNGYMLSKIPPVFRKEYIDKAKTMKVKAFSVLVAGVIKSYREAVRQGKLEAFFTEEFDPQPHLRNLKTVQGEYRRPLAGPLIVASEDCKTPLDGWKAALQWAMHLDKKSVKEQERAARARARKKWFS